MSNVAINFNIPTNSGDELLYLREVFANQKYSGDGFFNKKCEYQLTNYTKSPYARLTPSCSAALEMSMFVCSIKHGDEVIMPSYTFSSTANAVLIAGGVPVFIDCKPDDLNIDENLIEAAITPKTKAIMPMHYAGAPCEMDQILAIAKSKQLYVVSDAAQAIGSKYKKQNIESLGHISTLSFHETKNLSCGEGGAILINDKDFFDVADIIREKGTNRKQFFDGIVDKYTWHRIGSSYLMNEFSAAVLSSQLNKAREIVQDRTNAWNIYHDLLEDIEKKELLRRSRYPNHIQQNGHIYFIILRTVAERLKVQQKLADQGIHVFPHYVPLHSSPAGNKYCRTASKMTVTDDYSQRLLRLPMYYGLKQKDQETVVEKLANTLKNL